MPLVPNLLPSLFLTLYYYETTYQSRPFSDAFPCVISFESIRHLKKTYKFLANPAITRRNTPPI